MAKTNNPESSANKPRELTGKVVSIKMNKTISVNVSRSFRYPMYGKIVFRDRNYLVHCEDSDVAVGDTVRIAEIRPMSKRKTFRFVEKVQNI